jgi:hypothetical protein
MPPGHDLTDTERAEVAAMWAFRAAGEHETAAQYEDLARRLQTRGADPETIARVAAASQDEVRHRGLCAEMAGRAGQRLPEFSPAKRPRIAPHDLGDQARLCYEMVALFCVTESINATLLLRSWQSARDDQTRAALHALLTDEVRHSRIGWAYLSEQRAFNEALAPRLPLMLAAAVHDEDFLAAPSPPPASPALAAHGLLPQADRRRVFLEAMTDVVLPGLELCQVRTTEARRWLSACTGRWS